MLSDKELIIYVKQVVIESNGDMDKLKEFVYNDDMNFFDICAIMDILKKEHKIIIDLL